jgi:hypothetical protein
LEASLTAIVVAPRIEDPLSDTEAVASGGWVQIRPSAAYVAGGQWVQPVWSDPVPLVGVALTFQLDPLPGTPYELRGEIPDGESGVFEIHEFRIVTSSASPLGWETLAQVSGPSGGAVLTGIDQARLTALEAAVGGVSGGASNLASITDMSAYMRTVNVATSATAARTTLGAAASASPVFTGTVTIPDGALAIADTAGLQTALDAKAPLASPALTGTPTVPTATAGTSTTQAASTAFVTTAVSAVIAGGGGAPIASPAFTGNPTAPTPTAGDNDTSIATTAFVTGAIATVTSTPISLAQMPPSTIAYADGAGVPRPTARTDMRVFWTAASTPTNGISGDIWFNGPDS